MIRWLRAAIRPGLSGLCIGVIIVYALTAIFAPFIAPHGQLDLVAKSWQPPGRLYWMGADHLGRDMLSRVIYGAQTTIWLALSVTFLSFALGVTLGLVAATLGGWCDMLLSRCVDALMAIPGLILALVVLSVLGSSLPVLIGVIAIIDSTRIFRLSRALAMDIVTLDFVEVARLRGESLLWVAGREIFPNMVRVLSIEFGTRFSLAILFISSLSFLGLGIQPPATDWGSMVRDDAMAINFGVPAPLFPAAVIAGLTIAVNLLVDALSGRPNASRAGGP